MSSYGADTEAQAALFIGDGALERAADAVQAGHRALALLSAPPAGLPDITPRAGRPAGVVIVTLDDPAAGRPERDSRYAARTLGYPLLEPATATEAFSFAALAFELSERCGTPVLMRVTTRLWGTTEDVPAAELARLARQPNAAHARVGRGSAVLDELRAEAERLTQVEERLSDLAIITAGPLTHVVREALPGASVLKLGMTHPLPCERIRRFSVARETVVVIEEMAPFLEEPIRALRVQLARVSLPTGSEATVAALRSALGA
jgi:indolepyruvate ferredoxin oxidoreductase, alpha subunit